MHERAAIVQAMRQVKKIEGSGSKKQKAEAFFELVRQQQEICWPELITAFRKDYYDAFDEIVPRIFETDDPQVMFHVIQHADMKKANEVAALQTFVETCNAEKHEAVLDALNEMKPPKKLADALAKRLKELEQIERVPVEV